VIQQEAMGEAVATTNAAEQKASRGVIEEPCRDPWKEIRTPEQRTYAIVPPDGQSACEEKDQQRTG